MRQNKQKFMHLWIVNILCWSNNCISLIIGIRHGGEAFHIYIIEKYLSPFRNYFYNYATVYHTKVLKIKIARFDPENY